MGKVTKALSKAAEVRLRRQAQDSGIEEVEFLKFALNKERLAKEKLTQELDDLKEKLSEKDIILSEREHRIHDFQSMQSEQKGDLASTRVEVKYLKDQLKEAEKRLESFKMGNEQIILKAKEPLFFEIERLKGELIDQGNLIKRLNKITSKYLQLEKKVAGKSKGKKISN